MTVKYRHTVRYDSKTATALFVRHDNAPSSFASSSRFFFQEGRRHRRLRRFLDRLGPSGPFEINFSLDP